MIITILICVTITVPTPTDEVLLLQGTMMDHHSTIITIHGVVLLIMILLYSYVGMLEIDHTMSLHTLTCPHHTTTNEKKRITPIPRQEDTITGGDSTLPTAMQWLDHRVVEEDTLDTDTLIFIIPILCTPLILWAIAMLILVTTTMLRIQIQLHSHHRRKNNAAMPQTLINQRPSLLR